MVGTRSDAFAVCRGVSAHRTLEGRREKSVGGGEKKSMSEISFPLSEESMREAENFSAVKSYF